ncbi:MAG: CHAT domain-containing protein, partial [Thermoplasmata archaeon]
LKAQKALEKFDYEQVETLTTSAVEEVEKGKELNRKLLGLKEQAEDLLKDGESNLKEIKEKGIKITNAEELMSKAKTAMANSEYHLAQKHSRAALDECKEAQRLYKEAQDNLQKAQTSINNSKMFLDIDDAKKLFKESQAKMDEGNYSEASEFAIKAFNGVENTRASSTPVITHKCSDLATFKSGTWGKLQFEILNEGKVQANEIELKLSGQVETMGISNIQYLKAGESKKIGIGVRTTEIGEIPVNLDIVYKNPITNEEHDLQDILWIKTEMGEGGAKPESEAIPSGAGAPKQAEPEGIVKVLSEVEFFQGFVRLKVGIRNEMNTVVTDAKLDLEFDENAMRLDFTEPDFERKGNKIIFGVIHPKEKRTVAFYLDPLICTESYVDGTLTYKDIYGELKTSAMKRRKAEIVCPILYTTENINTAMLKRLMDEELTIHDSKIYEVPEGIDIQKASDLCKETVQSHDLRLVREFIEDDPEDPEIEVWYYGITKVKKNKVVIKSSVRRKTNSIQLFVACTNKQVLTGFLAELGHNLNDKLKDLGVTSDSIYQVKDSSIRDTISQTNTLLQHTYSDKTTLSISKRGDEYEVSFKASEEQGDATELCEFIKVSPDSRLDVIDQINEIVTVLNIFTCTRGKKKEGGEEAEQEPPEGDNTLNEKIRDLSSLGQLVYGMFLPVPIQRQLEKVNEPVILKTNDNEIPWELLHDDTDFLCLKVPIGRKLRSREAPRSNQVTESKKIRFLFIANPTGDLKGAEEEVDYIISKLDPQIEVDVLKGRQASNASILSAFRSGRYDIIHYAGHAEFNKEHPDESALISANERKIYAQEIKRILGGKPFVFLNACESGMEKMCEDGESYTGSDTEGLASSFVLGGSLGFMGASWPMPDISAGILASEFYKHVLKGEPVGVALHNARLHLKNNRPNDINWMAFTLYGDPTIRLDKKID